MREQIKTMASSTDSQFARRVREPYVGFRVLSGGVEQPKRSLQKCSTRASPSRLSSANYWVHRPARQVSGRILRFSEKTFSSSQLAGQALLDGTSRPISETVRVREIGAPQTVKRQPGAIECRRQSWLEKPTKANILPFFRTQYRSGNRSAFHEERRQLVLSFGLGIADDIRLRNSPAQLPRLTDAQVQHAHGSETHFHPVQIAPTFNYCGTLQITKPIVFTCTTHSRAAQP